MFDLLLNVNPSGRPSLS
jgi:hypothetical protein